MRRIFIILFVLLFAGFANSTTLTVQDHTRVMRFLLDHPTALKNWLSSRGRAGSVSPDEVFNFISSLARTRSSRDMVQIINRARNMSRRTRGVYPGGIYNNVIQRIRSARSLAELRNILSSEKSRISRIRTRNRMVINLSMGLEIAYQIIEDGMANGIYSPESYSVFLGKRRTRSIWSAIKDQLLDTAKDDAVGAVVGVFVGPEGAIGGAIAASSASVAEVVLDLILNPEPAY